MVLCSCLKKSQWIAGFYLLDFFLPLLNGLILIYNLKELTLALWIEFFQPLQHGSSIDKLKWLYEATWKLKWN